MPSAAKRRTGNQAIPRYHLLQYAHSDTAAGTVPAHHGTPVAHRVARFLAHLKTQKTSENQALARWHGCFPLRRGEKVRQPNPAVLPIFQTYRAP